MLSCASGTHGSAAYTHAHARREQAEGDREKRPSVVAYGQQQQKIAEGLQTQHKARKFLL